MSRYAGFLLFLALFPSAGWAQDQPAPIDATTLESRIDSVLNQIVVTQALPGLAFGIVFDGAVLLVKAYGVRDINSREPLTTESLFHMASVSKPFVATAVVQLMEDGLLGLDDPVTAHLPYFRLSDPRYREITIRQMLSHTSGMPDTDDYGWDRPEYDEGALERYVRSLTDESLVYDPGTYWGYSNIAFEVLGDLIAKVSGMPFERYMKTHILNPSGMPNSTFLKSEVAGDLGTSPHIRAQGLEVSPVYPYNRAHAPSSTLHSSVREMCNWALTNLSGGEIVGRRILAPQSYELLWKEYTRGIGLGWFMGRFNGMRTFRHGGGDTGFSSELVLVPEAKTGVVVMSNSDYAPVWETSRIILALMFDRPFDLPPTPALVPLSDSLRRGDTSKLVQQFRGLEASDGGQWIVDEDQLNYLGSSFLLSGRVDSALAVFEANLRLFPESPETLYHLGRAQLEAGELLHARENLERSLALDPDNVNTRRLLAKLKAMHRKRGPGTSVRGLRAPL